MVEQTTLSDLGAAMGMAVAANAAATVAPVKPKIDAQGRAYATGRRKNAIARVWIKRGTGKVTVNGKVIEAYFARPVLRMLVQQPMIAVNRNTPDWMLNAPLSVVACQARRAPCVMAFRVPLPILNRTFARPSKRAAS